MRTTTVPAVVDALLATVRRALPYVQVLDGPRVAEEVDDDAVVVGLGDGDSIAGYSATQSRAQGLGAGRATETFTIRCWLSSYSGDTDIRPRRQRAAAMLAAVDLALRGDRTLGGVATRCELGPSVEWLPVQTADGAACGVQFDVTGEALL